MFLFEGVRGKLELSWKSNPARKFVKNVKINFTFEYLICGGIKFFFFVQEGHVLLDLVTDHPVVAGFDVE